MIHPCEKLCGNKTASGYCATTACINPQYSNIGTAQYGQGVQKRIITNADRIRSMSDEELAEWMANNQDCYACEYFDDGEGICKGGDSCREMMLNWLRQEVSDAL